MVEVTRAATILLSVLAALGVAPAAAQGHDSLMAADSVVLERTRCFGTCPAYRLSVTRSGSIHFESRNPGEENRRAADTIPAFEFAGILTRARLLDFLALPDRITNDKRLCPHDVSDNPTAIVTLFMPGGPKRVEDYYGCDWAPAGLRDLEHYIDEIAKAGRWIQPAAFR